MNRMCVISLMLFAFSFAKLWEYNSSSYTRCLYDNKLNEYNKDCKDENGAYNLKFDIGDSLMTYKNKEYALDSTIDNENSDGNFVRLFYSRNIKTDKTIVFAFSRSYINIASPGEWKIGYQLNESDTNYYTGSGFGITPNILITNYHVIKNMKVIVVKIGENLGFAKIQYLDKDIDLAILKVDSTIKSCKVDETLQDVGSEIIVFGFPKIDQQGKSIKATKGIISSKFGYQDDVKTYQIDAAVQNGNSGGPLAKENKVVGVVVSKLAEGENVNYAIKSIYLAAMLKSVGIKNTGNSNPKDCTYLIIGMDK